MKRPGAKRPSWPTLAALVVLVVAIFFFFKSFLDTQSPVNVEPPRNTAEPASTG